jgi:hypothetical protein
MFTRFRIRVGAQIQLDVEHEDFYVDSRTRNIEKHSLIFWLALAA